MLDVENFCPPRVVQVPQSKILILGPVGAGKSSFFNTIASVFRGHVTGQAPSGCAEHSITSKVIFPWPRGYKTFFVLNSAGEHEIFSAKNIKCFHIYLQRNFHAQLCLAR